jgi:hypothetical protein
MAKDNDAPNWLVLLFTGIAWPIVLYLWHRRKVNSIPGLEVRFAPGSITINGKSFDAIGIEFINHTGSVAYITGPQIRRCSHKFKVPIEASRDIGHDYHHMKFLDALSGQFEFREITLQTGGIAKSCMAVSPAPLDEFYRYSAPWYRRCFGLRKYFVLEYTAMVARNRFSVLTVY